MLDPATIRETPDAVRKAVRLKGDEADVDGWIALDAERRELIQRADELRALRNRVSEEIAGKKKEKQDASREIAEMRKVGEQIQAMDERLRAVDEELQEISIRIPNVPHPSVPEGDASANEIVRTWGEPRAFPFAAKVHYEIGESLGILDFQRASKVASAGFAVYWSAGALLQRALIRFMIDLHTAEHGYREVYVPFLVNADSMFGTGQLPKLASDMYLAEKDGYYLIPTAEVPVTNLHRDEILSDDDLPLRYVGYTACFRREAGAAGRDTRGLGRMHQFDKVELVRFVRPEESYDQLEELLANAEEVLRRLELPYRVVVLATGDLSFASAKTYDIEVWAPGQEKWLEVSSCSNFEDFQARRMKIRYKPSGSKGNRFVHTLNGSGLALPRTTIALLEHYQREDGSVEVPPILQPYMNGLKVLA